MPSLSLPGMGADNVLLEGNYFLFMVLVMLMVMVVLLVMKQDKMQVFKMI
jgi:hypothetical protein